MSSKERKLRAGIIGCGNISDAYFVHKDDYDSMTIVACADLNPEAAKAKSEQWALKALSPEEMLTGKEVDLIINLTTPQSHAEISLKALKNGKHVHGEKPFTIELKDGKKVLETAKKNKLLTSCAPDTFLGAGQQTCRKLIDDGWIGKPVSGTAFMMCPGHESWHPAPAFYYQYGGGPMLDMGPYYITALVNLLGPVKSVAAMTSRALKERICTSEARFGEILPVEIDTHVAGTLLFESGAVITVVTSFDVHLANHNPIEIHGTRASLQVPDPNCFDGDISISSGGTWEKLPRPFPYKDNFRSVGAADMAAAVIEGRKARCGGELAYHVLEVMHAFEQSSREQKHVAIQSKSERPAAIDMNKRQGHLLEKKQ